MGKYEILNWSGEKAKQFGHAGRTEDPYLPEEGQEASLCTSMPGPLPEQALVL